MEHRGERVLRTTRRFRTTRPQPDDTCASGMVVRARTETDGDDGDDGDGRRRTETDGDGRTDGDGTGRRRRTETDGDKRRRTETAHCVWHIGRCVTCTWQAYLCIAYVDLNNTAMCAEASSSGAVSVQL